MLWLTGIVTPGSLWLANDTDSLFMKVVFIIFGALPLVGSIIAYGYFMFTNPDYLRSEEYHLKKQSLELLGDKDNILRASASDVVAVSTPKMENE